LACAFHSDRLSVAACDKCKQLLCFTCVNKISGVSFCEKDAPYVITPVEIRAVLALFTDLWKASSDDIDLIDRGIARLSGAPATDLTPHVQAAFQSLRGYCHATESLSRAPISPDGSETLTVASGRQPTGVTNNLELAFHKISRSPSSSAPFGSYGLFLRARRSKDTVAALRHVMRVFVAAPQLARTMFCEVFDVIIQPRCEDLYEWDRAQREEIKSKTLSSKIALKKAGNAAGVALGAAVFAFSMAERKGGHAKHALDVMKEQWKELSAEPDTRDIHDLQYKLNARQDDSLKAALNKRCAGFARDVLSAS
jgi:hypothetical protein